MDEGNDFNDYGSEKQYLYCLKALSKLKKKKKLKKKRKKKRKVALLEGGAKKRAKSRVMWAEVVRILIAYYFL